MRFGLYQYGYIPFPQYSVVMQRIYSTSIIIFFLFISTWAIAQNSSADFSQAVGNGKDKSNVILSLDSDKISSQTKRRLKEEGASIQAKYPDGTLIVAIPIEKIRMFKGQLKNSVKSFDSSVKISEGVTLSGQTEIVVNFNREISKEELENLNNDFGLSQSLLFPNRKLLASRINGNLIEALAELPFVSFIHEKIDEPTIPLGENSVSLHNAAYVKNNSINGLSGKGVVAGVGDGGQLGDHIDFDGRIIDESNGWYSSFGDHGDKVTGLIGSNGNINEKNEGLAHNAKIVIQQTYRIFYYLDTYYKRYGMNITNNSYGSSFTCAYAGKYEYYSYLMDDQVNKYEDVLHVVAGGNSGLSECSPYPTGYATLLRNYTSGKNTLTVGSANLNRTKINSSSAGPTVDGRIKPEITSLGQALVSTNRNYGYSGFGATSGATAVTTGLVTLLYEKYKQKNSGENPNGGLIKAILCNTADDAGNPGPDFQFGFGIANIKKAVEAVEEESYFTGLIESETTENIHTISIPEGKSEMKVMLYWADKAQSVYTGAILINDLDIKITTPSGVEYFPLVLDSTPANVANNAVQGTDRLNNIEQIVIPTPEAGDYTISISAYNLDTESQKYSIVHTSYEDKISLTFPNENDVFTPGEKIRISWENHIVNETGGFSLDYSSDNGNSWTNISSFISSLENGFNWTIPSNLGIGDIIIRVNGIASGKSDVSKHFNVLAPPSNFAINNLCRTKVDLNWNPLGEASEYEVFMLKGGTMQSIGSTPNTSFSVRERMDIGSTYWFAVKAVYPNGKKSRRTVAQSINLSQSASCPWNDDIEITAIDLGQAKGREYTSTALSTVSDVSVELFNAGTNEITSVDLDLISNGNTYNESLSLSLQPGESTTYTFSKKFDFSKAGIHDVTVTANLNGDGETFLNTISGQVSELANEAITLPRYNIINGFSTETNHLNNSTFGIENWESFDFDQTMGKGILSRKDLSIGSDFIRITNLNEDNSGSEITHLSQTLNLENYKNRKVFLHLSYRLPNLVGTQNLGPLDTGVKIQVRGSDTDTWSDALDLTYSEDWSEELSINLQAIIKSANQNMGQSTQIRIEVAGENQLDLRLFDLTDSSVLPVEMAYFNATKVGDNTLLEWGTASEINNDFFEVQVAKGDENFENGFFEILGKVDGNGNSTELIDYRFADNEKFKSGTRYYRLKQVDFDGRFEYSNIIPVFFDNEPTKDILIFPNVIMEDNQPNLYVRADEEYKVDLILTRADGKIYDRFEGIYPAGSSTIQIPMDENVPSGLFYVTGKIGEKTVSEKIIKVE